jgi:hypothetical protein
LKIENETFDINPGSFTTLRITMDLGGQKPTQGTYHGNLKLSADNSLRA